MGNWTWEVSQALLIGMEQKGDAAASFSLSFSSHLLKIDV